MRKLKTRDIPAFCRTLKAIGIKDEVRKIAEDSNTVGDAFGKGFELIYGIFDIATEKNGETHLYEFLAPIFECSVEELADMDAGIFVAGCKQIAADNDLGSFFDSAAKLMK